jgi:hypothetical protein
MTTVRIRVHLESDTLTVKSRKLLQFAGKDVEVTVREEGQAKRKSASGYGCMRGTVIRDDDDPFGPAVQPEEWEALR